MTKRRSYIRTFDRFRFKMDGAIIWLSVLDVGFAIVSYITPILLGLSVASTFATSLLVIARIARIRKAQRMAVGIIRSSIKERKMEKHKQKIKAAIKFVFKSNPKTFFAGFVSIIMFVANGISEGVVSDAILGWLFDGSSATVFYLAIGILGIFGVTLGGLETNTQADKRKAEKERNEAEKCLIKQAEEILEKEKQAKQTRQEEAERVRLEQIKAELKKQNFIKENFNKEVGNDN